MNISDNCTKMSDKFNMQLTDFICIANLQSNLKPVGVRTISQTITLTPLTQNSCDSKLWLNIYNFYSCNFLSLK